MTPAGILAAARLSPLSPVVPAREEWLEHWVGPVLVHRHHPDVPAGFWDDGAYIGGWADSGLVRTCDQERMRLDLHRREVRHRLVDCGALPAPLRDHVAAAMAAGMGSTVRFALGRWEPVRSSSLDNRGARWGIPRRAECFSSYGPRGWELYIDDREPSASGPENGMVGARTGRLDADLAALRAGCVLEEADGWYIPLPDGGVGWLPREGA